MIRKNVKAFQTLRHFVAMVLMMNTSWMPNLESRSSTLCRSKNIQKRTGSGGKESEFSLGYVKCEVLRSDPG